MYSSLTRRVNAKRLPPLSGKTGWRSPEEKSRAHSISSPGDRSGAALRQSLKDIWEALGNEGLQMTYHVFHMTVWRARKTRKPTATCSWGKQHKPSESQGLQEAKVETVEGRDPFANLRRLEEDRPGFHWRVSRTFKTSVPGTEGTQEHNEHAG